MASVVCCEINRKCFFYPCLSKSSFCFLEEMHTALIEAELAPACFPVAQSSLSVKVQSLILRSPLAHSDGFGIQGLWALWDVQINDCTEHPALPPELSFGFFCPAHSKKHNNHNICHGDCLIPGSTERAVAQGGWKLTLALSEDVKEAEGWGWSCLGEAWACPLLELCLPAPCIHSFPLSMTKMPFGGKKVVLAFLCYWEKSSLSISVVKSLWVSTGYFISTFPS